MTEKELYGQVWDILVTLNAVNNTFTPFSAHDIKTLIAAKLKQKHLKIPSISNNCIDWKG